MRNMELEATVRTLKAASKKGSAIWSALSEDLDKSKRRRVAVNLSAINRYTEEGDVVAIPGKVLGSGSLIHSVTVASFSISQTAKEKIAAAGGKTMPITELVENVEPSKIKILK